MWADCPTRRLLPGVSVRSSSDYYNSNDLQLNYQRPFRNGVGFRTFYVLSAPSALAAILSVTTFSNRPRTVLLAPFPLTCRPALYWSPAKELNKFQNYKLDTTIPLHRVISSGIMDILVGKGKPFLGNSNKCVNAPVGADQVVFVGTMVSRLSRSLLLIEASEARLSDTRIRTRSPTAAAVFAALAICDSTAISRPISSTRPTRPAHS